jgi:tetratricopeptide (TPR) repeat protein
MFFSAVMKLILSLVITCFFAGGVFAQEKKRGDYEFHLKKAQEYFNQKNYDLAMESVKGALRTKRNDPNIYLLKADINFALDKFTDSIKDLQKASRIGSEEADKRLAAIGSKAWKALEETEAKEFEKDLEEYLRKVEEVENPSKTKKEKKPKKTKTR